MTIIKLFTDEKWFVIKESYQTIKRRVHTSDLFFEITISGQKVTINKTNVEEFGGQPKTSTSSEKVKKTVKKLK